MKKSPSEVGFFSKIAAIFSLPRMLKAHFSNFSFILGTNLWDKYCIVASRSTYSYSGNHKLCFLKSRLVTCRLFFLRTKLRYLWNMYSLIPGPQCLAAASFRTSPNTTKSQNLWSKSQKSRHGQLPVKPEVKLQFRFRFFRFASPKKVVQKQFDSILFEKVEQKVWTRVSITKSQFRMSNW